MTFNPGTFNPGTSDPGTPLDEQALRALLRGAAQTVADRPSRDLAALHAGHRRRAQRRRARLGASGLLGVLALTGAVLVRSPAPLLPATLTCTPQGPRLVGDLVQDPAGTGFTVRNTTGQVVAVSVAAQTVYAPPGQTQVTVPAAVGAVAVTCGSVGRLTTTVHPAPALAQALGCAQPHLVTQALAPEVLHGGLVELTRAHLQGSLSADALPTDATLATDPDSAQVSVRQVRVTAGSQLVAVARWHVMPLPDEWHLESLQSCL